MPKTCITSASGWLSDTMPICEQNNSVLVIIDVQEKLAAAMPPKVYAQLQTNTLLLIQAARLLAIPIVYTLQYPKGLGQLDARIQTALPEDATVIEKTCFSCAGSNAFTERLQQIGRNQLCLVGMEAHICVLQTAIALQQRTYAVFVIEDAISSRKRVHCENAIERMQQAGIHAIVTESILFEWLQDSTHPYFKTLSKLIT